MLSRSEPEKRKGDCGPHSTLMVALLRAAGIPARLVGGLVELKKMIKEGRCDGANRYVEKFDWYKANQKRVIKNWNMPDYNW